LVPLLRVLVEGKGRDAMLLHVWKRTDCARFLRADLERAGCSREALHKSTETHAHLTFHNLRDTCLTDMAVRRDPPQDIQWRAGHTTAAMTEKYIENARYEAGANFGEPLPPLPACLLTAA
jgi:integrase